MIDFHESIGPGWVELATPGSAVRHALAARHVNRPRYAARFILIGNGKGITTKGDNVVILIPYKTPSCSTVVEPVKFSRPIIALCMSKVLQNAPKEHSAIRSIFIKLPFVLNTFVLCIFEWLLKTGFTVYCKRLS